MENGGIIDFQGKNKLPREAKNIKIEDYEKRLEALEKGGGGSGVEVVQETGQSTTAVMSQKAVTDALGNKQDTLQAGSNITIENNTINATDTTYSSFTGTDGVTAGVAGLVPAPTTSDGGKFLKGDGSWTEAPKEIIQNAGAPTTSTAGTLGQLLTDTTNAKLYQCTAIDNTDPQNPIYTWTEVGGGGGGSSLPIHVVYAYDPDNETHYSPYIPMTAAELTAWNNGEVFYVDFSQMTYKNYIKPYMADLKQVGYVLSNIQGGQIVQSCLSGDHAFFLYTATPIVDGQGAFFEFENRPSGYIDYVPEQMM